MTPGNSYAAGTKSNPIADGVHYFPSDDAEAKTGIKSITLNPYTYVNMSSNSILNPDGNGEGGPMTLDANAQYRIAKYELFPKWSVIAESVFRDQAAQMVTMKGTGMMDAYGTDKNSFNTQFSFGAPGADTRYEDSDFSLDDLAKTLSGAQNMGSATGQQPSIIKGSTGSDEVRSSGITAVSDLDGARTFMGQELKNCQNNNALSVDDFLGNDYDQNDGKHRLPVLQNTKSGQGFCNVVTCINQRSNEYDYVSFGLMIYDLSVTPISAEGLRYIGDTEEYLNESNPVKAAKDAGKPGVDWLDNYDETVATYSKNDSASEITTSQELGSSISEEVSTSKEESFEWGMSETIGIGVNIGNGSFTGFLQTAGNGGAALSLSYSHTFNQTWSEMFGQTESKATGKTKTQTTEITLPPHTIGNIKQNTNNITAKETYQQPFIINYKVCLFSLSGDYYNDGAAVGRISSSMYDKGWMSVIFDGSDGDSLCGNAAMRSLYNRAVDHKAEQGYDGAIGSYKSWCDKSAWSGSSKINWDRVAYEINRDSRRTSFKESSSSSAFNGMKISNDNLFMGLITELPFCEVNSGIRVAKEVMTSSVDINPLYDLGSVSTKNSPNYNMLDNDRLYLDTVELEANNRKGVEFYKFDPAWGEWQFCDANGKISDTPNQDGQLKISDGGATGAQYVYTDGVDADEHYLKWVIKDDAKIVTNESPNGMSKATKAEVETPVISISIHDQAYDNVNVSISADGSCETTVNQSLNLNDELTASALLKDKTSDEIKGSLPVYWEIYPEATENADIQQNGTAIFTKDGTYRIRAYCLFDGGRKVYSAPLTITVRKEAAFSKIAFTSLDLDEYDLKLTKKAPTKTYSLSNYLSYRDQYGKEWTGEDMPEVTFSLDDDYDTDGAYITNSGTLTVTNPGTYRVLAKAKGYNTAATKLTVTQDEWLSKITFSKPVSDAKMVLQGESDSIQIDDLESQISYLDQNGNAWEGKKPTITFTITPESDGAEIIRGDSFFVNEPGTYTIQPSANGYTINSQTITVTTAKEVLTEITTADPPRQKISSSDPDEEGGTVTINLEPLLSGKSQFGTEWKDMPAMNFTLDSSVTNASIKETTITDDDSDTVIRYGHQFVTSEPGKYNVHVAPAKASSFSGSIDDIIITVDADRKLASVMVCLDDIGYTERTLKDGKCTITDLSQYLKYFDQFQTRIKNQTEVPLPEITGYKVEGAAGEVNKEADGTFTFSCTEIGEYKITPIFEASASDIDIFYDFDVETLNVIDETVSEAITKAKQEVTDGLNQMLEEKGSSLNDEQLDELLSQYANSLLRIEQTTSADAANKAASKALNSIADYLGTKVPSSDNSGNSGNSDSSGNNKSTTTAKANQTSFKVGKKNQVLKAKKLKKKAIAIKPGKALKVLNAKGAVTYKLVKVKKTKFKKYFKINSKTGKIKVKKKLKKGTYKLQIKVTAAGDKNYKPATRTVVLKIKVK